MSKNIHLITFCLSLFLTNCLFSQNSNFPIKQSNLDSLAGKKVKKLNEYLLSFDFKFHDCHYISYDKYKAAGIVFSIEGKRIIVKFKKEFRIKNSKMYKEAQHNCLKTRKIQNLKIKSIELIY